MSGRREIEFPWGDTVVRSRPTLARFSEVEQKFGPAPTLLQQVARSEMSITKQLLPLLVVMLRGCDDVPKDAQKLIEQAYEHGAEQYMLPMVRWLQAGFTVDEPTEPQSGN
jgi:hypothetical protein